LTYLPYIKISVDIFVIASISIFKFDLEADIKTACYNL